MGYKVIFPEGNVIGVPIIDQDDETGTTSWRDAKKALRQWYLDRARELRGVSENDYFNNEGTE